MLLVSCLMVAYQFCKATARQTLVAATKLPGVWWPLGSGTHETTGMLASYCKLGGGASRWLGDVPCLWVH